MSVTPAGEDVEGYCEPEDVAEYFDKPDFQTFTEETNPSRQEVERRIKEQSSIIDEETGHAWRERQVEGEYKEIDGPYYFNAGTPIHLQKRDIRTPLDSDKGDKIELYQGQSATDLVASDEYEEGRDGDYWVDESTGQLHIYRRRWFWERYKDLRLTYRYGKETIPPGISHICAKLVAADLMRSQHYRLTTPGNEEAPNPTKIAEQYRDEAMKRLERFKEVRSIGVGKS